MLPFEKKILVPGIKVGLYQHKNSVFILYRTSYQQFWSTTKGYTGLHPDSSAGLTQSNAERTRKSSLRSLYRYETVHNCSLVIYLTLSCCLRALHLERCHNTNNTRTPNVVIFLKSNIYTMWESCYPHVNGNRVKSGSNPIQIDPGSTRFMVYM